ASSARSRSACQCGSTTSCAASSGACSASSAKWRRGACAATSAGNGAGILSVTRNAFWSLPQARECAPEKLAAMPEAFLVDAVADAFGEMPLRRNAKRSQPARCLEQRLGWNEVVAVAVHKQNWRARLDLGREGLRLEVGWHDQQS